ncbi:thermostable hemolysin [Marinobacterium sp. MBR-109]|jgi:hypothetical protein|uniref:thermostable hemolysin n=1 Tax=Marinobacterium sp. MBR-109 TaxID=3156462 RepID=UPI0033952FD2
MSLNPPRINQPTSLSLHDQACAVRPGIEAFIRERFRVVHAADIHDFLPTLVSCRNARGELVAAAGFQLAAEASLFLETYLDTPIEHCLADRLTVMPTRDRIVEVGNLATLKPGQVRQLIVTLAAWFDRRQLEWAVLTLTPTLINSFRRLGLELHPLAPARHERLSHGSSNWGHYYDQKPMVVAVSIPAGAACLRRQAMTHPTHATYERPTLTTTENAHALPSVC